MRVGSHSSGRTSSCVHLARAGWTGSCSGLRHAAVNPRLPFRSEQLGPDGRIAPFDGSDRNGDGCVARTWGLPSPAQDRNPPGLGAAGRASLLSVLAPGVAQKAKRDGVLDESGHVTLHEVHNSLPDSRAGFAIRSKPTRAAPQGTVRENAGCWRGKVRGRGSFFVWVFVSGPGSCRAYRVSRPQRTDRSRSVCVRSVSAHMRHLNGCEEEKEEDRPCSPLPPPEIPALS